MVSPTPNNDPSSSPQDSWSTPNPPQRSNKAAEELLARAAANQNGPPRREKILPSERIDLSGRPGFATSGDWPKTKNIGGPVRILSKNGELTELGKRVEQERLAKLAAAATATSDDGGKEKEESSS
ncbi:hypothetical protein K504DRAFT_467173 [Pleomassaria siparia CBS 279.74]|uniref:Uncharacterized protein n=1 Tax=Pleomassaria siparia CBS 279.74 TaxID=1314801 RepID=A0A6G1K8Q3_9PLEO|nr:hypothetical protein K504DRAFT_467173 [Pleomassaria siparia CBS 279.74]